MRTAKTLITLGRCPSWPESSLAAQSVCWFRHEAAHLSTFNLTGQAMQYDEIKIRKPYTVYHRYCSHKVWSSFLYLNPSLRNRVVWGFTAQSILLGHVKHYQLTLGSLRSPKQFTRTKYKISPVTDNCPTLISGRERSGWRNYFMTNLHESYAAGLEVQTWKSWTEFRLPIW